MGKIVIQCNTFLKPDDFSKLADTLIKQYKDDNVVVLPVYCELRAVLDADDIEVIDRSE